MRENKVTDPFTYEIVSHKLWQITEEMALAMKNVSGSPIVTEANDFNVAISLSDGQLSTMGAHNALVAGVIPLLIRNILEDYGSGNEICKGDMFIINDPHKGALHQLDLAVVAPVHYQNELVAWTSVIAHEVDIGGMQHGSPSPKATEIFQEGLRIPALKLVEKEKFQWDIFRMILSNVRQSGLVGLDIKARVATNSVGQARLHDLFSRFGRKVTLSVMQGVIDRSEKKFRERLLELPESHVGAIDYIDHDGHTNKVYKIVLKMTKESDSLSFDYSGTDEQAPGHINCTISGLVTGVMGAVFPYICYDIPWNQGVMKAISIYAPEGSLVNCKPPAPTGWASIAGMFAVRNAAIQAVCKLLGSSKKHWRQAGGVWEGGKAAPVIMGINQYGERSAYLYQSSGGAGAMAYKDGYDCSFSISSTKPSIPNIETAETFAPVLFLFNRFRKDSGGSGKYRGGAALEFAFVRHGSNNVSVGGSGHGAVVPASQGIFGGYPGGFILRSIKRQTNIDAILVAGKIPQSIEEIDGNVEVLPAKFPPTSLDSDAVFYNSYSGGGGYGDPLDRDVQSVLQDVINDIVSPEAARSIYGVVLRRGSVDLPMKEELRKTIRNDRLGV